MYYSANNLYVWAMSQKLPAVLDGNKIHQCLMRLLNNYNENSDEIYIPEVDV